jgi:hypothetical protein
MRPEREFVIFLGVWLKTEHNVRSKISNSFNVNNKFQTTEHLCSVFAFWERSYPVAQADSLRYACMNAGMAG